MIQAYTGIGATVSIMPKSIEIMYNIAIFASGSGTNAENLARTFNEGNLLRIKVVLTDHADAGVIERMKPFGIETIYVEPVVWRTQPGEVVSLLRQRDIDFVALAGFMRLVNTAIIDAFPRRIINIHPALLPAYGGKGMWGHHVHEAVIAAGEKMSGVTVHYVDAEYDHGEIIMQQTVDITPDDTAETLEQKIHQTEYSLFPRALAEAVRRLGTQSAPPPAPSVGEAVGKTGNTVTPPPVPGPQTPPSVDRQWAETLQIDYDPQRADEVKAKREAMDKDMRGSAQTPPRVDKIEPMPSNYLVISVICTLLCCFVPGIVAIIYSSRVSSLYYQGDMAGAERASRLTQIWIIVSFCLGVIGNTLYWPAMIVQGLLAI